MNKTMGVREKLVDLLVEFVEVNAWDNGEFIEKDIDFGRIAENLIAHGVTVFPVKVGDTVYTNCAMRGWYFRDKDRPYSARVCFIGLNNSEEMGGGLFNVVYEKHDHMMQFRFSDIGKSVFLTQEEAEAHLPQPPKGE